MFKVPKELIDSKNEIDKILMRFAALGNIVAETFQQIDFKKYSENFKLIISEFEKLPEKQKKVVDELTKCGWYMNSSNDIHIITDILSLDKNNSNYLNNIDKLMIDTLKDDEIENCKCILKCFQNRESILIDAFENHKNGRYNCSIPVFLNQIDGITRDLLGIDKYNNFFKKVPEKINNSSGKKVKTGKVYPYTREIAIDLSKNIGIDDGILYSFLIYPLERLSCLCYDSDDIDKYIDNGTVYCNFSRHGIIHGKDLDYGTEINSYKCISILLYLCTLKELILDKN